jgi:D-alanine-D-alanine ligase
MMKRKVAVLMGGVSMERDVSLKSGRTIAEALRQRGHEVVELDIVAENIDPVVDARPDAAFIALHGTFGEDGAVQAMLQERGIAYTGSDPQASRAGMDKMASKCFFITHDIPTPPFRLVTSTQQWNHIDQSIEEAGLPLAVKPLRQGSSIGVSIAKNKDEVAMGLSRAFKYGPQALLERYIEGREFTVGILGERALPLIELRATQPFFNYEAKYVDEGTEYITRPDIPRDMYEYLQEIALGAHRALGCRHYSRVDLMLEDDGCPYVLEVNTIPGFTERSLMPLAANEIGVPFPELCEMIVEMAVADAPPKPVLKPLPGHNRIAGQAVAKEN